MGLIFFWSFNSPISLVDHVLLFPVFLNRPQKRKYCCRYLTTLEDIKPPAKYLHLLPRILTLSSISSYWDGYHQLESLNWNETLGSTHVLSTVRKIINSPSDSNLFVIETKSFRFSRYEFISVYYTCFAKSRTCLDILFIVLSFVLSLLSYLQVSQAERFAESLQRTTTIILIFSDHFETISM